MLGAQNSGLAMARFEFKIKTGAREMAQQLRTLAALGEDLSYYPASPWAAHSCLEL